MPGYDLGSICFQKGRYILSHLFEVPTDAVEVSLARLYCRLGFESLRSGYGIFGVVVLGELAALVSSIYHTRDIA